MREIVFCEINFEENKMSKMGLQDIAPKIDDAIDATDRDRISSFQQLIENELETFSGPEKIFAHYLLSNCLAAIDNIQRTDDEKHILGWDQPWLVKQAFHLRSCANHPDFDQTQDLFQCAILTNLGNLLDTWGRPLEALQTWRKVFFIEPNFAIARANRATSLTNLADELYDPGHANILRLVAEEDYEVALSDKAIFEGNHPDEVIEDLRARKHFLSQANSNLSESLQHFRDKCYIENQGPEIKAFTKWRLEEHLFVNPLNDCETWTLAGQDIFHLPDHRYQVDEEPRFPRYFDHLKEELVAGCVLFYEGYQNGQTPHHADKMNLTFDHSDFSVNGVNLEKQKAAFRIAFSIFDKVAGVLNEYFDLGHKMEKVNFWNVWSEKSSNQKQPVLHSKLPRDNWRLRGLFGLAGDLNLIDREKLSSPLAEPVRKLRNAAEHRFLSVHEFIIPDRENDLVTSLTQKDFENLCIHTLRMARNAIMYLSLAIARQEALNDDAEGVFLYRVGNPKHR